MTVWLRRRSSSAIGSERVSKPRSLLGKAVKRKRIIVCGARYRRGPAGEPDFDLAWKYKGRLHVAEVKSITEGNESKQLRFGLGQVLDYQELLRAQDPNVVAVVALPELPRDSRWARLCARHHVILVTPASFALLLD